MIIEESKTKTIVLQGDEIETFNNILLKLYTKSNTTGFNKNLSNDEQNMIAALTQDYSQPEIEN